MTIQREFAVDELVGAAYRLASEWREEAVCNGKDEALWFDKELWHNGKALCETCPVMLPCLLYAFRAREDYGVYGGLDPSERRKLARSWNMGNAIGDGL